MTFIPIQKILPKAINSIGIKREVEAAVICEKYRKLAPRCIHANALEHTSPKYYKGRTLVVAVENSAWAYQVSENKAAILSAINDSLGREAVKIVKTQVVPRG